MLAVLVWWGYWRWTGSAGPCTLRDWLTRDNARGAGRDLGRRLTQRRSRPCCSGMSALPPRPAIGVISDQPGRPPGPAGSQLPASRQGAARLARHRGAAQLAAVSTAGVRMRLPATPAGIACQLIVAVSCCGGWDSPALARPTGR